MIYPRTINAKWGFVIGGRITEYHMVEALGIVAVIAFIAISAASSRQV